MRGERPADAQTDAVVSEMVAAGILTVGHDIEGRETWTLTPKYAQVARQMAMSSEEDAVAMFTEILDAAEADDALSALGAHEPVIVEGDLGGSADTRFPHRQHAVKHLVTGPPAPCTRPSEMPRVPRSSTVQSPLPAMTWGRGNSDEGSGDPWVTTGVPPSARHMAQAKPSP